MIDRRAFLSMATALPLMPRLDMPDLRVDNLELANSVQILSMSPNAEILVGTMDNDKLCFFDTASLEEISVSNVSDAIKALDPFSLRWSPDSSKVVFGIRSLEIGQTAAFYIANADAPAILNPLATAATPAATPDSGSETFAADLYPEWLDDTTIVFVRQLWNQDENYAVLMGLDIDSGESWVWNDLEGLHITMITSWTRMRNDGRLVFLANPRDRSYLADPADQAYRLFIAVAGEAPTHIEIEGLSHSLLLGADETHALLADVANFRTFRIALDDPSVQEDVLDLFAFEDSEYGNSYPAIGPVPGSMVISKSNNNRTVLVYKDGIVREIAYLRGPESTANDCMWVNGRVLVTSDAASWVIELED